jgi:hypothetical protein
MHSFNGLVAVVPHLWHLNSTISRLPFNSYLLKGTIVFPPSHVCSAVGTETFFTFWLCF